MTEWGVLLVLGTVVGFAVTVAKPIITLTRAITRLTTVVERLQEDVAEQEQVGRTAHEKLWKHNDEQDRAICGLDTRVSVLERRCEDCEAGQ